MPTVKNSGLADLCSLVGVSFCFLRLTSDFEWRVFVGLCSRLLFPCTVGHTQGPFLQKKEKPAAFRPQRTNFVEQYHTVLCIGQTPVQDAPPNIWPFFWFQVLSKAMKTRVQVAPLLLVFDFGAKNTSREVA